MTDDLTIKEAAFRVRAQLEEGDAEVLLHAGHARALVEEIERLRVRVTQLHQEVENRLTAAEPPMRERIARAIARKHYDRSPWYGACPKDERLDWLVDTYWGQFVESADAVLAEMETPTEVMTHRSPSSLRNDVK